MENTEGAGETPQDVNLSEVSSDDLREAISNDNSSPAREMESGTTDDPSLETPPDQQTEPEVESLEDETEESERLAKRRIRPRTPEDQQVFDLYKSEGFDGDLLKAARIIHGEPSRPQPQQPVSVPVQEEQSPQPDPYEARIGEIKAEIQGLEEKITIASENLETTEALTLQRELIRKDSELQRIHDDREYSIESSKIQREQAAQSQWKASAEGSRDKAFNSYPELQNREGIYRKEFDSYVNELQSDTAYSNVFNSPNWPELMAHQFAAVKGVQQQQDSSQQKAPAMGTQAKVLTTGTTAQSTGPLSGDQAVAEIPNLSKEDLWGILGSPDGRRVIR